MKLIIAGSRHFNFEWDEIDDEIDSFALNGEFNVSDIKEIISGGAPGIDQAGEKYAKRNDIDLKIFPAGWDTHGKAAGPIRNKQMAEYADALLLIWDGRSRGSANMKSEMTKLNKPIYEVIIESN